MKKNNKFKFLYSLNFGVFLGVLTSLLLYLVPLDDSNTKLIIVILIGCSIGFLTSLVLYLNERLHKSSVHDDLTGLYNVNFLSECKYRVMAQTDRQQGKMGVVIADINRLKDIISLHGSKAGEEVLRYVGEGLTTTSRASEFIFRLESDDFLIFFSDINEYSNIKVIKSRLETFFQKPLLYNDVAIEVKLDFGFAVYPEDGDNFDTVMNVAKQRLYIEKSR